MSATFIAMRRRWSVVMVAFVGCSPANSSASSDAADAGAAADASVQSDATEGADAPTGDASEPTDDGGPGFCATNGLHFFCDDFDEDPLAHNWDNVTAQHGSLALDRATATSPPYSLLASSMALSTGAVALIDLSKSIIDTPPELHVAFDLEADAIDADVVVFSLGLLDMSGAEAEVLNLRLGHDGAFLDDRAARAGSDGGDFLSTHTVMLPAIAAPGSWSRVQVDVVYPGDGDGDGAEGGGELSLSVDAHAVLSRVSMAPTSQPSLPVLRLGLLSVAGPSAATNVHFDNFTFDTVSTM